VILLLQEKMDTSAQLPVRLAILVLASLVILARFSTCRATWPAPGRRMRWCRRGRVRLACHAPDWGDFVRLAVTEIRQFGGTSFQIARRLKGMLGKLYP
jgi:hypothetical protein